MPTNYNRWQLWWMAVRAAASGGPKNFAVFMWAVISGGRHREVDHTNWMTNGGQRRRPDPLGTLADWSGSCLGNVVIILARLHLWGFVTWLFTKLGGSTVTELPQDAIEAAAEAIWNLEESRNPSGDLLGCTEDDLSRAPWLWADAVKNGQFWASRQEVIENATAALAAAVPFLRQQWEREQQAQTPLGLTAEEWDRILSAADCGIGVMDLEWQPPTMDAVTKLERAVRAALDQKEEG